MLRVWFGNSQLKVCVVPRVVLLAWQPKKAAGCQVQLVYVGGVGWGSQQAQHSLLPLEVFILRTANTCNDLKHEMRDVL